jgi:hypothetical protein
MAGLVAGICLPLGGVISGTIVWGYTRASAVDVARVSDQVATKADKQDLDEHKDDNAKAIESLRTFDAVVRESIVNIERGQREINQKLDRILKPRWAGDR